MHRRRRHEHATRDTGSTSVVKQLRGDCCIAHLQLRADFAPQQRRVHADVLPLEGLSNDSSLLHIRRHDS
jgi:hypothetical protein